MCSLISRFLHRTSLSAERCRNKEAAAEATNMELYSITPGLMLKNSAGMGVGSYDYVL
jgi:hypothetical protein